MGLRPATWRCSLARGSRRRGGHAPLEADRAAAHAAVVGVDHVLPVELVLARQPGVASRAPGDRADDLAAGPDRLAAQLTEDLVTTLVGPHGLAGAASLVVGEPDRIPLKADAQAALAVQEQRAGEIDDRRLVTMLERERAPRTGRRPRAFERPRLAGSERCRGLGRRP